MKLVAISDTHNAHRRLDIPECDFLIHAGDESARGEEREVRLFAEWFDEQPAKYLIWIPGNHSLGFEARYPESLDWIKRASPRTFVLMNEAITVKGIKIWGSPVTPWFHDWAYNVDRGSAIAEYWSAIPPDADIVVTHGPPHGILDLNGEKPSRPDWSDGTTQQHTGCEELAKVIARVKPKFHIFGHIHEARGVEVKDGTTYVNASIMDRHYVNIRAPFIFDYPTAEEDKTSPQ